MLCCEFQERNRFKDGIIWIELSYGQKISLASLIVDKYLERAADEKLKNQRRTHFADEILIEAIRKRFMDLFIVVKFKGNYVNARQEIKQIMKMSKFKFIIISSPEVQLGLGESRFELLPLNKVQKAGMFLRLAKPQL